MLQQNHVLVSQRSMPVGLKVLPNLRSNFPDRRVLFETQEKEYCSEVGLPQGIERKALRRVATK